MKVISYSCKFVNERILIGPTKRLEYSLCDKPEDAVRRLSKGLGADIAIDDLHIVYKRIKESARQELHEEHTVYVPPVEGLQLADWKEGSGL